MKNSNHASKALAVVLSGALAFAPAANAALDDSNMAYTAASEGFYGSLRVQYQNTESGGKNNDSSVDADSSRLGVGGTADLGGGLEAFYGFEWNLGQPANGDTGLSTRQNHVGLRGDWGSVWLGAFDSVIVRFGGFATTDILDQYSGNFEPTYRTENALAYISPDLNGFQFGVEVQANDGKKGEVTVRQESLTAPENYVRQADPGALVMEGTVSYYTPRAEESFPVGNAGTVNCLDPFTGAHGAIGPAELTFTDSSLDATDDDRTVRAVCEGNTASVAGVADDGNDFDVIGIGASYSIQGLTFSGAYRQTQDALVFGYDVGIKSTNQAGVRAEAKDLLGRANKLRGNDPLISSQSTDDKGEYALGIRFNQDNWVVAAMYGGEDVTITKCMDEEPEVVDGDRFPGAGTPGNECDVFVSEGGDATFFSFAGGVSIDKLDIHGLWEQKTYENAYQTDNNVRGEGGVSSFDREQTIAAVSARYHLGSKARLRAAWLNEEIEEGNVSTDNTKYALGMVVDF